MDSNPGNEEIVSTQQDSADHGKILAEFQALRDQLNEGLEGFAAEIRGKISTVIANQETHLQEIKSLRAYVETIEAEAHKTMQGLTSPEAMMEMAGKFLGNT